MNPKSALIIVDLNNDFMPGGRLAVEDADQLIPVINDLAANGGYDYVVAAQDWHPEDHPSFQTWPVHCVAGTKGAELHPGLDMRHVDVLIRKGFDAGTDSYSGFYNADGITNGLAELLQARKIDAVDVVGLATDYCVKETAIEAATKVGLKTRVLLKGCRGVGLTAEDVPSAIQAMAGAGVEVVAE